MILTRQQFAEYFNSKDPRLGSAESPLWEPERVMKTRSEWFVCVKPLVGIRWNKDIYWQWCNANLSNKVCCYSSDDVNLEEWWGFENRDDIIIWTLRWAG